MVRSHNRKSHSILKSVPRMERDHKVTQIINEEKYSFHEGYSSLMRQEIKKMHKKKRRQFFKNEINYDETVCLNK